MEKALKVNLNQASLDQLEALPWVDRPLAENIIAYRREHGGFKTIDELGNVGPLPVPVDDFRADVCV